MAFDFIWPAMVMRPTLAETVPVMANFIYLYKDLHQGSLVNGNVLTYDNTMPGAMKWGPGVGGGGTVTSITGLDPIVATPNPITATGTIGVNDFKASGASHDRGTVPDPGAVAGTTRFLREDATWAVPPGAVAKVYIDNYFC